MRKSRVYSELAMPMEWERRLVEKNKERTVVTG
jgi:hypothetical protein